jgi:hypothetical protein
MKGLVCLLADRTEDFSRTVELELSALYGRVMTVDDPEAIPPCDLLVIDLDHARVPHNTEAARRIGYTRHERTVGFPLLVRPFRMAALRALVTDGEGEVTLRPSSDFRTVTVGSEAVALSDREARILALLYEAGGAVVSRQTLAEAVFPQAEAPEDSINVYIHYLRKKLERNKKRLIRAHRGGGYSLLID